MSISTSRIFRSTIKQLHKTMKMANSPRKTRAIIPNALTVICYCNDVKTPCPAA
ncbi:MAG: hypothetical protein AAGG81_00055 [Chlamydiota bacterium]